MQFKYLMLGGLFLSGLTLAEETVEVLGYRAVSNTPVSYQNIDKQTLIEENIAQEPSFLLSKMPSITNYSDSGSYQGYSYIRMRGMDQTRINMTLDGVPLNEPEDQGVYFSNYSGVLGAIQGLQIQRGVGTSQNGTASFAGSIQLKSIDLHSNQKNYIDAGIGSFDTLNGSINYLSGVEDGKGFFVQIAKVKSDGYKYHSGNDSQSIFASGIFEDTVGYWKLTGFSGEQSNELAWLGVGKEEIDSDPRTNGNSNENDNFKQSLIYLTRYMDINDQLHSTTTAYYNTLKGNYDFDLNNFLGLPPTSELYKYAFDSNFFGIFSNLEYKNNNFSLTGGLHVNEYSRTHIGTEKTMGSLYENTGHKNSVSGFLSTNYQLDKFNLFADIQYRKTTFEYDGGVAMNDMEWSFVNPKIGLSFAVNDELNIYYSVGKTGREPTRTDLLGGNENLELNANGEPNLFIVKPEYVVDHEFGARYKKGDYQSSVNFYYMDFSHEITLNGQVGPNGLPLNQDVGSSARTGIELLNNLKLSDQFDIEIAASVSKNNINNEHEDFHPILTPENILNFTLSYHQANFYLNTFFRYQSKAYLNLSNDASLDPYTTLGMQASCVIENKEFRLQLNNVMNKQYFNSGLIDVNGQPKYFVAAPFNISASVRVSF